MPCLPRRWPRPGRSRKPKVPTRAPPTEPSAEQTLTPFSRTLVQLIGAIPAGAVTTYGDLATAAGRPRAARQVARLLHSVSDRYQLPWHRVVNRTGCIV